MQENIVIGEDAITGTLKYVSDYTGFSGDVELQSGNYLALHCESIEGATIKAELVGGSSGEKTLDADGLVIVRITDTATESFKVTATKGDQTETVTFDLSGLTLEEE